ncbi:hypothetical protein Slin14017_G066030 [Septoria linicola]|nr:hypothetical protein Slin14017_G066030 [Septoria linicola]
MCQSHHPALRSGRYPFNKYMPRAETPDNGKRTINISRYIEPPEQAMRLVSRIIRHTWPIWHAILCSDVSLFYEENGKTTIAFPEPVAKITEDNLEATMSAFEEVAAHITFIWNPNEDGVTLPERDILLPTLPGVGSLIAIPKHLLNHLKQAESTQDHIWTAWLNFEIASLIVHELAHACTIAATPIDLEPELSNLADAYLGPHVATSEIGFEVEQRVWGGIPYQHDHAHPGQGEVRHRPALGNWSEAPVIFVTCEWPDERVVHEYASADGYGFMRAIGETAGKEVKGERTLQEVSTSWLGQLFEERFWRRLDWSDRGALWIPETTGFRVDGKNEPVV